MDDLEDRPAASAGAGVGESCPRQLTGLRFRVASSLDEVAEAWRLVYTAYRRGGLIPPNPSGLHTAPQAVGPGSAVVIGAIGPVPVSTLTAVPDGDRGLPLDRVYHPELQSLRRDGRRLVEIGLFADRRHELARSLAALFELMRHGFHYGLTAGASDVVIGVHPRHARFYARSFRFEPLGAAKTYAAVNHRPVVLLRGDLAATVLGGSPEDRRHPALDYFLRHPVSAEAFASRYRFDPASMEGSVLAHYLRERHTGSMLSQTA